MSLRVMVIDRLCEVTHQLEGTAAFAILLEDGQLNWADPVHVKRDGEPTASPRSTLIMFQDLALKAKLSGSAFELSPGTHCLIFPVPFEGKRAALGCVV